jgi:hypothetical protein
MALLTPSDDDSTEVETKPAIGLLVFFIGLLLNSSARERPLDSLGNLLATLADGFNDMTCAQLCCTTILYSIFDVRIG